MTRLMRRVGRKEVGPRVLGLFDFALFPVCFMPLVSISSVQFLSALSWFVFFFLLVVFMILLFSSFACNLFRNLLIFEYTSAILFVFS